MSFEAEMRSVVNDTLLRSGAVNPIANAMYDSRV